MATWVACIVETKGRADFWDVARKLGVRPATDIVPAHTLIGCDIAFDFDASDRLAAAFSRELLTTAIDELGDEDIARYEVAKRAGDASGILALLHPSSTFPMLRVCASLGIDASGEPAGTWKKPSLWSRLFGS